MPKVTVIEPTIQRTQQTENSEQKKLRVAAYARVSTDQEEQESSYEAQVDYYTRYIKSNPDWEFIRVFADRGITGTNTKNRDDFNCMVDLALNGGIDLILTKSISRFARNTVDTLQTVRKLKAIGVEVIFEKENLHTLDPKCEVMLTIMSSLAQEESRSISENVRWGKQKSMQDGNVSLPYKHFLGYRKGEDGRPEIVEEEAAIVRKIYELFLSGRTIRYIANWLTEQDILTPAGKTNWSVSTIKSILTNEKYKGDALLMKTFTVDYLTKEKRKNSGEVRQFFIENSHEAIIEPEIFDYVQEKMKEHCANRVKIRSNHPFANRLICSECGEYYGHKVWHTQNNAERYDVWYCNHKYKQPNHDQTPVLREEDIKKAFEKAASEIKGEKCSYSEDLWRSLVKTVTVFPNESMEFLFVDDNAVTVLL